VQTFNMPEEEPIANGMISKSIQQAQIRIEGYNFDIRKRILEYDDVVNKQRETIYEQRREILVDEPDSLREKIHQLVVTQIHKLCEEHLPDNRENRNLEAFYQQTLTLFPAKDNQTGWESMDNEAIELDLVKDALRAYDQIIEIVGGVEKMADYEREILLGVVDDLWIRHLTDLSVLREGIGLQGIRGRDPLVEYKIEGFQMYQALQDEIQHQVVLSIYQLPVRLAARARQQAQRMQIQNVRAVHHSSSSADESEEKSKSPVSSKKKLKKVKR